MAWPPAVSGTWAVRDSFSGSEYPRPTWLYYVSDTQIYFGDPLGIAIYDAINGTATVIGSFDSPNDWGLGDTNSTQFTFFNNDLYAAVSSAFDASEAQKVFRYGGTPHSWTKVYQYENAGVLGSHNFVIMTSLTHLIIASSSVEGFYIKTSTNPSLATWSTISSADVIGEHSTRYISNDGGQAFASVSDIDSGYLGEFSGGNFTNIGTFAGTYVRMPGYHWNVNGSDYSIDGTNWFTANVADAEPMNIRNYTKFMGYDDGNNRMYFWDDSIDEWAATFDTISLSGVQQPEAFILSDGTPIIGRYSGSTTSFYQRNLPFHTAFIPEEVVTGKRLYIYKSEGADWVSRGIKTI
jgi:hypothetical protein